MLRAMLKHMLKHCAAYPVLAMHVRTYVLTESYSPLLLKLT